VEKMKIKETKKIIFLLLFLLLSSGCSSTWQMRPTTPASSSKRQTFLLQKKGLFGNTTSFMLVVLGEDGLLRAVSSDQPIPGSILVKKPDGTLVKIQIAGYYNRRFPWWRSGGGDELWVEW